MSAQEKLVAFLNCGKSSLCGVYGSKRRVDAFRLMVFILFLDNSEILQMLSKGSSVSVIEHKVAPWLPMFLLGLKLWGTQITLLIQVEEMGGWLNSAS